MLLRLQVAFIAAVVLAATGGAAEARPRSDLPAFRSRADSPPRKVIVASTLAGFRGSIEERLRRFGALVDRAAARAAAEHGGRGLDLIVFPEFMIQREDGREARDRAVRLAGPVREKLGAKAREHRTWIVAPMILHEEGGPERISNAAVLVDRSGEIAGIFRKVHPVLESDGRFEGGVTPGGEHPVFACDFGRLGILICWDMSYEESWAALAHGGAEIVALPSASPQTLRPAAAALRHQFYVVTSTPRDNASLFDPIGRTIAQVTDAPDVLVHEIDLAYAILHWSEELREGRAFSERFGARAGYSYSRREDTGVFWSNDPSMTIGEMVRELGLTEMPVVVQEIDAARRAAVP